MNEYDYLKKLKQLWKQAVREYSTGNRSLKTYFDLGDLFFEFPQVSDYERQQFQLKSRMMLHTSSGSRLAKTFLTADRSTSDSASNSLRKISRHQTR